MGAKSRINFVLKNWSACTLLTVTVVMATIGSFPARGSIQNKSVEHRANTTIRQMMVTKIKPQLAKDKSSRSVLVGKAVILNCPPKRHKLIVSWNVNLKNGTICYLSYMSERNVTDRNCSTVFMKWLSRPDKESSLHITSPQIFSEGIYKCSTATANGTFSHEHALTVLVPPKTSLTYDNINGIAICKAAAGKPAADISWVPQGEYYTKNESLHNGTQTVTSVYNTNNSKEDEVTCVISHPAWKESFNISLGRHSEERKDLAMRILYSSLTGLLGILLLSLFIYLWRFLYGRRKKVTASKSPEPISRLSIQENEMEPYATFVQVENVIYEKACDFSLGEHFPPGLSLST
ncbi:cell surface glycoprotein CD200 receptor 1 [Rhineura floridana]|uniref:cell surface glycoprotein CD200 receptor 1 n=1 Tax=Rhineura floridana TaxID=261503 RepID=UPI002AC87A4D|nr:cell surface glycoprotein CD200 receptor 1 [Rhineura floridana]